MTFIHKASSLDRLGCKPGSFSPKSRGMTRAGLSE
jgi:hypothetical protein